MKRASASAPNSPANRGVAADVVVPVPDSGVPSAMGYAAEAGIPFELGIIRNHYVGRTFIEPTDQIRNLGVKLKHSANKPMLEGKRVILVDDSIVRGTTSRKIVEMVRAAGAKEVHMRVSSPPTTHSCYYGIDTPERAELMAAKHDLAEMARIIGVDSLAFISLDGLYRALGKPGRDAVEAGFLRRLLHRGLRDPADGLAEQFRQAVVAAATGRAVTPGRGPCAAAVRPGPGHQAPGVARSCGNHALRLTQPRDRCRPHRLEPFPSALAHGKVSSPLFLRAS